MDAFAARQLRAPIDCPTCGETGAFGPGNPIPLAVPRSTSYGLDEVRQQLATHIAQQIDKAVLGALARRGLSLSDAIPRLTRRVQGSRCTVLLDGAPIVEVGPPRFDWSADRRTVSASVETQEVR